MGRWIVYERLSSHLETNRATTIAEADELYTARIERVRRCGGSLQLYHEDDPANPVSRLECPMPEGGDDPEEGYYEYQILGYVP